jgi:imidazoleglycerol-phosphate dehydratase
MMRTAEIERKTNETEIKVRLNLDGRGIVRARTGLGFLDHMLTHIAVHGLFDLDLEDCALVLGKALDQALGDRAGIVRMGSAYVPMDESLAFVSLDLSGRPYAVVQVDWHSPAVGGLPTSLIDHFCESLAVTGRLNLHARVLYGRDDHHQAEALFKALGRALDAATRIDPRRKDRIPSTKGTLA